MIRWIAVDWGTSNLRIWGMGADGGVLAEKASPEGMSGLAGEEFQRVLLCHIGDWLSDKDNAKAIPVVACGMVGARQGWVEAPYAAVPAVPAGESISAQASDARIDVRIIAGMSQDNPPDVMRGEETQIVGFLSHHPGYDGSVCLPGTHSKWVRLGDGKVQRFRTVMTGEVYALLGGHSILRHGFNEGTWDEGCFTEAVRESFAAPESMLARLFGIRARGLLEDDDQSAARISGMLIGAELAGTKDYWQNREITIIGEGQLARHYGLALDKLGVKAGIADAENITLDGLRQVHGRLFGQ